MGKSACVVGGPRPELVSRAVPVSVLDVAERGVCPDVVLTAGTRRPCKGPPLLVVAPPATCRALFPGFTLQLLGDGPLLAFSASAQPPGLLAALQAFFPVEVAPPGDLPEEGLGPEPRAGDRHLGWELDIDEDEKYLLS